MATFIVLISVNEPKSRDACEFIENMFFEDMEGVLKVLGEQGITDDDSIMGYELSNFMDAVNDQDLDVLTEYFISYVKIGE